MKLMIVDDNKGVRTLIRSLFENRAEQIIECSDGQSAVEQYDRHIPDYVLMDIEMKRMDGFEATRKIIEKHPGAKIIIVTSHANYKFYEISKQAGATEFVSKENLFELEEIIRV